MRPARMPSIASPARQVSTRKLMNPETPRTRRDRIAPAFDVRDVFGLSLCLRRWRGRRFLKTWPHGDAVVIRCERLRGRDCRGRFREFLQVIKDGHQVDVGEGQAVAGKVAA